MDSFLPIAEEPEPKGLMGKSNQGEHEKPTKPSEVPVADDTIFKDETRMTKSTPMSSPRGSSRDSQVRTVVLANELSAYIQELDEQISTFMTKSSRKNKHGQHFCVCNVCRKEGIHRQVKNHIEANHLEGISIPCNFC